MANSGGGCIIVGIDDEGVASGYSPNPQRADSAEDGVWPRDGVLPTWAEERTRQHLGSGRRSEREFERLKSFWLDGIARVVAAPPSASIQVVQTEVTLGDSPQAAPMRLTHDQNAPVFRAVQAEQALPLPA